MPVFLLKHQHTAGECDVAFAAWQGFVSPLRRQSAVSTCLAGGHTVWWRVEALDRRSALALLPPYVARRTDVVRAHDIQIP